MAGNGTIGLELLEDLPHPWRLGQAELREVSAVDLEVDVA